MQIMAFLLFEICFCLFVFGLVTAAWWFDRVAVRVIRLCGLPVYSTAVMIAMSIVEHPEEWQAGAHEIHHKIIGDIWTGNDAYGLHVNTAAGSWKPGYIERRIIREAVDWRLAAYIRNRIQRAMMQHALTGKITEVSP